jgi:FtsP/CotA-like multicopper oxidase with cupredoxin domain
MHLLKFQWSKLARNAWSNRQELVREGLTTRRDLLKLGLLTGAGLLIAKHGLSSRVAEAKTMASPPTRSFVDALPIMPVKQPLSNGAASLIPYPTISPNNLLGEGRTRPHQAFLNFPQSFSWPPSKVYEVRQRLASIKVSPDLPTQQLWGFDGMVPGPTYYARYGEQILVRNRNQLPMTNGGFGMRSVSTHLHNGHTPSESDGFPGDYFPDPLNPATRNAQFYDQHYPNVLAGFSSTHPPYGDLNESMSTLWYHDHRVGFTAQNTYKGLVGFYCLYNQYDCGDETNTAGFRYPGVRDSNDFYKPVKYDIPLALMDRVFDPSSGAMFFDLFNFDGILGDKVLVNGVVQPYLDVEPRRYRFRILNAGPSRFYHLFLTDQGANTSIPFWQIANDGNLLPYPVKVLGTPISVAERMDVIVDFRPWAGQTLYLENRWIHLDGRGPVQNVGLPGALTAPGAGNFLLQFRVKTGTVRDDSVDLDASPAFTTYPMPSRPVPRVVRSFRFERVNNLWMVNGKPFPDDASTVHFRVQRDSAEQWSLLNKSGPDDGGNTGGWMHPIHMHFEEFQLISRAGRVIRPGDPEYGRKDVIRMGHNELNLAIWRFRDFQGRYPFHCHNVLHEDHAMMLRLDIDDTGDTNPAP